MSLFRGHADGADGIAARRPHAGLLRRERRALAHAREGELRDLGGLLVEMYRRGGFRDDLLAERAATVVGIDARLAEIDELLQNGGHSARCECGAPILRGSHFCPNCGAHAPGGRRRGRLRGDGARVGPQGLMGSRAERAPNGHRRRRQAPALGAAAGAHREISYCLDCGLRLPASRGTLGVAAP